jgi:nucleoside-diphosphate-sugar epimerase
VELESSGSRSHGRTVKCGKAAVATWTGTTAQRRTEGPPETEQVVAEADGTRADRNPMTAAGRYSGLIGKQQSESSSWRSGGMTRRVLITGGAGFIGSHVTDELLAAGYEVRGFDNGAAQVHGQRSGPLPYLSPEAEYIFEDVRNGAALHRALRGVDGVLDLAAVVGVGQSMYEVERYAAVNEQGSATLMQALLERRIGRLVVASSMSVYGEGRYHTSSGEICDTAGREPSRPQAGQFNIGSGESRTVGDVALQLASVIGRPELAPEITGRCRTGDVRHCYADIERARRLLGFQPRTSFEQGLEELAVGLGEASAVDRVDEAAEELVRRGLVA